MGTLLGEDRKIYTFRRSDVREVWFHDLTEAAIVAFEAGTNLSATRVCGGRAVERSPKCARISPVVCCSPTSHAILTER
jgi:hypothetical protein